MRRPPSPSLFPDVAPWTTHANEIALLFSCARTTTQDLEDSIRTLLGRDLDWDFVLAQSARHGVDPLVYHHLTRIGDAPLPSDVQATLQTRGEGVLAFNLHRLRALTQIVETLTQADIPALAFKGPMLAHRYYDNLGYRRFADLDLLVPRSALRRADTLLQEHGFVPSSDRSDAAVDRYIADQVGLELVRPSDDLQVELHWALLNKSLAFSLDPDDAWARAESHRVGSTSVQVLSAEDLLLYLCVHGTKHHWARLKWICDVAEVCRRAALDWDTLLTRARALDADRPLLLGLRLADRWLDAPLPSPVRSRLYDNATIADLADHVETQWLFTPAGLNRTPRWEQFRFFLRTHRRWAHKWPLLREYGGLALTPTDNDRALVDLPPSLSALYYLIRPLRLLRQAWRPHDDTTA